MATGCTAYVGAAKADASGAMPEVNLGQDIGVIGVEKQLGGYNATVFCEHISGLGKTEKGMGLNMCGGKAYFELFGGG